MKRSFHSEFNARWLSPEEVALQFVPIPQFERLLRPRHSLLLGPRGSGKTTLLKMMTRRALDVWRQRTGAPEGSDPAAPAFEAIYIPSDVRWAYELRQLEKEPFLDPNTAELIQRCLVASSVIIASIDAFETLLRVKKLDSGRFCSALIDLWELKEAVPTFGDLRSVVGKIPSRVRGLLNRGRVDTVRAYLETLPDFMFGHSLDFPIGGCKLFAEHFSATLENRKWALCFDELEIAPAWLRQEIISSLRSSDQEFILKLTSAPILPSGLWSDPEPAHDYQIVRLWNSHVEESQQFCEDLALRFFAARFPGESITPDDFLGFSHLAAGEDRNTLATSYERGGFAYNEMRALALEDRHFSAALARFGLSADDPYSENVEVRDQFLRKVKPVVLLRRVFRKAERRRSRKVITAYAGKQAVYAMSEGNPRWMLGLLNDLYDRWASVRSLSVSGTPNLKYKEQAKVLFSTAKLFHTGLAAKSSPDVRLPDRSGSLSLVTFLDAVGGRFASGILDSEFPVDPYCSFIVDGSPTEALKDLLRTALEVGALVHVGQSGDDVPRDVIAARLRPTFMLAPLYHLPLRNYRPIPLSGLLSSVVSADQFELFDSLESGPRDPREDA